MSGLSKQYGYQQAQEAALAASIHVGALVRVIDFNPVRMTVNVRPIVQTGDTTGSQVLGVPVAGTRGGGFIFRPVYQPGDIGVVLYLDHDMDEAMARGGDAISNTERRHSDNDAVFVGGLVTGNRLMPALPSGIVMATEDGGTYLAVGAGGITIKGNVTVDGDVTAGGISLVNHTHPGVTTGGDNTEPPQ